METSARLLGQRELGLALGAGDAVLGQVLGQAGRLQLGVVLLLPLGELLAGDILVLFLPLQRPKFEMTSEKRQTLVLWNEFEPLTGRRQDAQVTVLQSGHTSRFCRGLAMKPESHCKGTQRVHRHRIRVHEKFG